MLSEYFKRFTNLDSFKKDTEALIKSLEGKKVLIYGVGEAFFALDNIYNFRKFLNIVAFSDKKFETSSKDITGFRQILPNQVPNEDFDVLLVTNEQPKRVYEFIINNLKISEDKVRKLFNAEYKEEGYNYNLLCKYKFPQKLPKLVKKLKGKKVLLYGAGAFLETILKYFDLSGFDINGVADKGYNEKEPNTEEKFHGFNTYGANEIEKLNPDYILICTKFYIEIIEYLYYDLLKNTKIKIKPLVDKGFFTLLKEIWL